VTIVAEGRILIIDDEQRLRTNLELLLGHEGYAVTTAANGTEGVACLQDARFDLVITDIKMAGLSGFDVMEYIAAHAPETPVIVITGYASTPSAVEALRKGAYDYISKPFEVEMIKIAIERALEKGRLQRALKCHMEELERRVAERTRALEVMNEKLNHSLDQLKATQNQLIQTEKLSALGELISGFAHELNNPLTSVLGYAELLAKSVSWSDQTRPMVEKLRQEAMRCYQIVKNLLGFARKQKPEKKLVNINTVCGKVLDLLTYQFKMNNITVVQEFSADLPRLMADEHQLQQVLVNILTNAYQALSKSQRCGRVTVTTTYDESQVTIRIADNGPGIAPHIQHRIFDPFFTTKEDGTGLGLSLSYGIIKEHSGEITVDSIPDSGTTFTIVLPCTDKPQPDVATRAPEALATLNTKKILVVDDEPAILQLLVDILRLLGHQADAVDDGREAIKKLDSDTYDLIICDLKMPDIDGYQMYHFLRSQHPEAIRGLIVTSGDTVSEKYRTFLDETGCHFLPKPFRIEDVRQLLSRVVGETNA
jgi:two-component system NtrC family sensor kinase